MSLALWEFFWSTASWGGGSTGSATTITSTGKFMIIVSGPITIVNNVQL